MKKQLLSLFILIMLWLCIAAHADGVNTPLQDPESFSQGVAEHLYNQDKETHLHKQYKVSKKNMESFINAYVDMLKSDLSLEYLGVTQNGKHIYHCFAPAEGYHYKTFHVRSNHVNITPTICLAVQYEENDTKAYLRYSKDFYITDLGLRMDMEIYPTSVPTPIPTPTPTKKPTATPKVTQKPTPVPLPDGELSGYGYVTTNSVNLRTGPGLGYRSLRFMHRYAFASVENIAYAQDGTMWYQITQNGDTGYVMSTYFKLLSSSELTAFLLSDEYLQGIKNNAKATATPYVTPTPYKPPVYVPTRTPAYTRPTTVPSGSQPVYLTIQDPATYLRSQISYQYSFNGGAYKQNCYRLNSGSTKVLAEAYINLLKYSEYTLNYGGVYMSPDGEWTYHYFTSPYAYTTFTVYYDITPVAPASCLIVGYSDDRVYLYYSPNFSIADEGQRYY